MRFRLLTLVLTLAAVAPAVGQPFTVDGLNEDWTSVAPIYSDPQGDGLGVVDFGRLWIRNDDQYLYILFETSGDILLQSDSGVTLGLDTDNDAATGVAFESLGAELVWKFGERIGSFTAKGTTLDVAFQDIGLVSAPSVTASLFEVSLELDAEPRRLGALFPSDTVRIALRHGLSGDLLPDADSAAVFVIDRDAEPVSHDATILRTDPSTLRLLAWNVQQDGIFDSNPGNAIGRILNAVEPDVMVFSEIFGHSASQTVARVSELYPPEAGSTWYGASENKSVVLVSRTPILQTFDVDSEDRARGFLVEKPDGFDRDLFFVGAHLFCCEADARRQRQVDEIMASIRNAQDDGTLPEFTPIVIAGDMNFVGDRRQPKTLVEGDIVGAAWGPSFDPDWDGTSFTDAVAVTTGLPHTFTWRNPGSAQDRQFSPGRLDYVIYSDAVLREVNSYALFTLAIPFQERQQLGLNGGDSEAASDHLPLVVDFAPISVVAIEDPRPLPDEQGTFELFPNPATSEIHLRFPGPERETAEISIFDVLGRRVLHETIVAKLEKRVDITLLPSGFYIVDVKSATGKATKGFIKPHLTK